MTDPTLTSDEAALQRRRFLRGGALLAAATGGAVVASASPALPARAAETSILAASVPVPPTRLLDTRTSRGRELLVRSSSKAFDSKHRLRKNAWLEVAVFPADTSDELLGVFVNLGSRDSTKRGSLVVTEPDGGNSPARTVHYGKNAEVNNASFVGVGVADREQVYVVRVYASASTHVVLDVTGVSALLALDADARSSGRSSYRAGAARVVATVRSLER